MINNRPNTRIYIGETDRLLPCENNLVTLITGSGDTYEYLEPRRLFPVHDPDHYITLLNKEGREVAIIRALTDLNSDSLRVITDSLNDYYLIPQIFEILSVTERNGTLRWKVKTNRGIQSFDIHNRNHDIRVCDDGSLRVRDADDNRYIVPRLKDLNKHSLRLLSSDL